MHRVNYLSGLLSIAGVNAGFALLYFIGISVIFSTASLRLPKAERILVLPFAIVLHVSTVYNMIIAGVSDPGWIPRKVCVSKLPAGSLVDFDSWT